jgi:hypothetical protein
MAIISKIKQDTPFFLRESSTKYHISRNLRFNNFGLIGPVVDHEAQLPLPQHSHDRRRAGAAAGGGAV